jgi:hypothetical protein
MIFETNETWVYTMLLLCSCREDCVSRSFDATAHETPKPSVSQCNRALLKLRIVPVVATFSLNVVFYIIMHRRIQSQIYR